MLRSISVKIPGLYPIVLSSDENYDLLKCRKNTLDRQEIIYN